MKILVLICGVSLRFYRVVLIPAFEDFDSRKFYDLPQHINILIKVMIMAIFYAYHLFVDCIKLSLGQTLQ